MNTYVIEAIIDVNLAPAAMALSPDGSKLYVACYVDGNPLNGTVQIINTATNLITDTIPGFFGPFAIAIAPDGNRAYVTNFGSNNFTPIGSSLSVIDLNSKQIIETIALNIQPASISITPDGKYAYVTNYNTLYAGASFTELTAEQGSVTIIDLISDQVIAPTINVGESPAGIAIKNDGQFAYVSNYTSNMVYEIALPTYTIEAIGSKIKNIFLTQKSYVNKITLNATGSYLPLYYNIYRNQELTDLAGSIEAEPTAIFYDYGINPKKNYKYFIIEVMAPFLK